MGMWRLPVSPETAAAENGHVFLINATVYQQVADVAAPDSLGGAACGNIQCFIP